MKEPEEDSRLRDDQRSTKRKPVDIPPSALVVKAKFWTEPDRAKVKEIAQYIIETGEAHTHPDVTYGPISKDSDVRYLEEFSLAERFQYDEDHWCVCAVCPHDLPQFKNDGVICWLPKEGTIKVAGRDCFKRLNPEMHRKAQAHYQARKKSRSDEAYLLSRLYHVPVLLGDLDHDIKVAKSFENVRAAFHSALRQHGLTELAKHTSYGKLKLDRRGRKGITGKDDYAFIEGAIFLSNTGGGFSSMLTRSRQALAKLDFGAMWEHAIYAMGDKEKAHNATMFGGAMTSWKRAVEDLERMRAFIRPSTGRALERWSLEAETSFPMLFEYAQEQIRIGLSPTRSTVIVIPEQARADLSTPPDMGPALKS